MKSRLAIGSLAFLLLYGGGYISLCSIVPKGRLLSPRAPEGQAYTESVIELPRQGASRWLLLGVAWLYRPASLIDWQLRGHRLYVSDPRDVLWTMP